MNDIRSLIAQIPELTLDGAVVTYAEPNADEQYEILWCNDAILRDTGFTREELVGASPSIFRGPLTDPDSRTYIYKELEKKKPFRTTLRYHRKDGSDFWCELSLTPIRDEFGVHTHWAFFMRNVSEVMELASRLDSAERAAELAQERLWHAIEALPEGFVIFDRDDRMVLCNSRFREAYSKTGEVIAPGSRFEDMLRDGLANGQYPDAVGHEEQWLKDRLERHRNPQGPIVQKLPGNRFVQINEVRTPVGDLVGFRNDITELKQQEQALKAQAETLRSTLEQIDKLSRTDTLTSLGNRRGLDFRLRELDSELDPEHVVAFLHIDLDRFKAINDVFGHAAGDFVLEYVARILRQSVRSNDYVARVGGDEFSIVLSDTPNTEIRVAATNIADRIIKSCAEPLRWNDNQLMFGASIGIAIGPVKDIEQLKQDSDIALYQAKEAGQNKSALFTPALRQQVETRKRLADQFLAGYKNGEVVAFCQPQVCAATGEPAGAEALVRWQHPELGVLSPEVFLPVIEDLGMTADLDELVLNDALSIAHACQRAGTPLRKISVNVSYRRVKALADLSKLKATRPWPSNLAFELLETIDFDGFDPHVAWTLDALREIGVSIEIDDFGSGRASLTTLLQIQPDRLKIDRSIVAGALSNSAGAQSMIRAIGTMANGLGIAMTAEGIETKEQSDLMRDLGCDVLQGYLYGQPMARADFLDWMARCQVRDTKPSEP